MDILSRFGWYNQLKFRNNCGKVIINILIKILSVFKNNTCKSWLFY